MDKRLKWEKLNYPSFEFFLCKIYFLYQIFWKALVKPFKWHIGKVCSISRKKVTLKNKKSLTFCPRIVDLRHCELATFTFNFYFQFFLCYNVMFYVIVFCNVSLMTKPEEGWINPKYCLRSCFLLEEKTLLSFSTSTISRLNLWRIYGSWCPEDVMFQISGPKDVRNTIKDRIRQ